MSGQWCPTILTSLPHGFSDQQKSPYRSRSLMASGAPHYSSHYLMAVQKARSEKKIQLRLGFIPICYLKNTIDKIYCSLCMCMYKSIKMDGYSLVSSQTNGNPSSS